MKKLVVQEGQEPVLVDMSPEDIENMARVAAAGSIHIRRTITSLTFLERLTPEERIAIRRAAKIDEGLEDWLDMLRAAQEVDLDDPRVFAGLNALVNAGIIGFQRRDEILA